MSGKSASERKEKLEQTLEAYETEVCLNVFPRDGIDKYLNLSKHELRALGEEECGEIAYMLVQYSMYIQKQMNRHVAIKNWATSYANVIIGRTSDNYEVNGKYTSFEEKKLRIYAHDDVAQILNGFIVEAQKRIDTLTFMSSKVESLSKVMTNLQQTKRRSKSNG